MKKILILSALSLLLFIASCTSDREGDKTGKYSREIDLMEAPQTLAYDSIIELPLKLPKDEAIGDFSKILYDNGKFFIMDSRQNRLWAFDESGNLAGILNAIGTGPGEYARLSDFDIADGQLYVLDVTGRKILHYSPDSLSFIQSIPVDRPGLCFAVGDSEYFYFENPIKNKDNTKLALWDALNGELKPILKYGMENEAKAGGKGRTHFWRSGQNLVYYDRFTPTVYILGNEGVSDSICFSSQNYPTQDQIQQMIEETSMPAQPRPKGASPIIRDIRDVYITPSWTSVNVFSSPYELLFVDNESGRPGKVEFDDRFEGCRKSAMGVCGEYFITLKEDDRNVSLILYSLTKKGN